MTRTVASYLRPLKRENANANARPVLPRAQWHWARLAVGLGELTFDRIAPLWAVSVDYVAAVFRRRLGGREARQADSERLAALREEFPPLPRRGPHHAVVVDEAEIERGQRAIWDKRLRYEELAYFWGVSPAWISKRGRRGGARPEREAERRKAFERWRDGETVEAAASSLGISVSGFRSYCSKQGWYHSPCRLPPYRALWKRRQAGETAEDLAAEVGVAVDTLRDAWRRLGYKARAVLTAEKRQANAELYRKAWGLRSDGASWPEVARRLGYRGKHYNLSRGALKWWRREIGTEPPRYCCR